MLHTFSIRVYVTAPIEHTPDWYIDLYPYKFPRGVTSGSSSLRNECNKLLCCIISFCFATLNDVLTAVNSET